MNQMGAGFPAMTAPNPQETAARQHDEMRARLNKLEEIQLQTEAIRGQLAHLTTLGDLVSENDVIESASKIVATGIAPKEMASLLADMPTQGGEALAAWIAGQEQNFRQTELQLEQALTTVRYETGLAAMRLLASDSLGDFGPPGAAPTQDNPLMPPPAGLAGPALGLGSMGGLQGPQNALMESEDGA